MKRVRVIGAGLAGAEASYQLLKRGYEVELYEMRPKKMTPCHFTGDIAELVCSNSLKSIESATASGMLKNELSLLDSLLLSVAYEVRVPAGGALAVDRREFSRGIRERLESFTNLTIINDEITKIDIHMPTIVATGPLTSDALTREINTLTGNADDLHFFDAVAPIVSRDSLDMDRVFEASRYDKGDASDYLNVGMNREEYDRFFEALVGAKQAMLHDFDKRDFFDACMPVEEMARRGKDTLRFGMLKPVGITNPKTGERYYAVVQLRKENREGTMYNLVGFQTNLTWGEQKRVFSMLPGLENAEFLRYGVMHRNTFLNAPYVLTPYFNMKEHENIFFAGQITGVEGYMESTMSGLIAGVNMARMLESKELLAFPPTTIIGGLQSHISNDISSNFQPMNANFGILTDIQGIRDKKARKQEYYNRGDRDMRDYIANTHANE